MATLIPQKANVTVGKEIVYSAATASGDKVAPNLGTYLLVRNASAAAVTVTLDTVGVAFNSAPLPDTAVTVGAGKDKLIPVKKEYTSPVDGLAKVTYSAVTSVTVAALRLS